MKARIFTAITAITLAGTLSGQAIAQQQPAGTPAPAASQTVMTMTQAQLAQLVEQAIRKVLSEQKAPTFNCYQSNGPQMPAVPAAGGTQ